MTEKKKQINKTKQKRTHTHTRANVLTLDCMYNRKSSCDLPTYVRYYNILYATVTVYIIYFIAGTYTDTHFYAYMTVAFMIVVDVLLIM